MTEQATRLPQRSGNKRQDHVQAGQEKLVPDDRTFENQMERKLHRLLNKRRRPRK
jgi:hypothetical protein